MDGKVYHYLHECGVGVASFERLDSKTISFYLPGEECAYELSVDERDRRVLIVVDGELMCGGLPKSATVVHIENVCDISCPVGNLRTTPDFCLETRPEYEIENKRAYLELVRNFILLPSCGAVVRKYRDANLSPVYVFISVFYNEKNKRVVEWKTTSS